MEIEDGHVVRTKYTNEYAWFDRVTQLKNMSYDIGSVNNNIIDTKNFDIFKVDSSVHDLYKIYKGNYILVEPISTIDISKIVKPTICVFKDVAYNYYLAKVFKIIRAESTLGERWLKDMIYNLSDFKPFKDDIIRFTSASDCSRKFGESTTFNTAKALCCIMDAGRWTMAAVPAKDIYGIVKYTHTPENFVTLNEYNKIQEVINLINNFKS